MISPIEVKKYLKRIRLKIKPRYVTLILRYKQYYDPPVIIIISNPVNCKQGSSNFTHVFIYFYIKMYIFTRKTDLTQIYKSFEETIIKRFSSLVNPRYYRGDTYDAKRAGSE